MIAPRLEVAAASVSFGSIKALDDVHLSVPEGEVLAVLGASGSGKSTLLRSVAGLQRIDSGRVLIDGRDVTTTPAHLRGAGLMFQDHALFPHKTVDENIAFGLRMQSRPQREVGQRVRELLELVGLEGFGTRRIQTLSGGEQQRVALARALAPEPRLLLLDEPLGSLDRSLRERLTADLGRLLPELGITALLVTHDQVEAFALARRIVVLDRGQVVAHGRPSEVWADPGNLAVAELLGFPNIAPLARTSGGLRTPWGSVEGVRGAAGERATHVLVRPAAVLLVGHGTAGSRSGRVVSSAFAGERTNLVIAPDGGGMTLEAEVPTAAAPSPGADVAWTLDPDGLALLGP